MRSEKVSNYTSGVGAGRCTFSYEKNKLKYRLTYNFHDTGSIDVIQSAGQLLLVNYSLYEHVLT